VIVLGSNFGLVERQNFLAEVGKGGVEPPFLFVFDAF
jgi:hypothetical protein